MKSLVYTRTIPKYTNIYIIFMCIRIYCFSTTMKPNNCVIARKWDWIWTSNTYICCQIWCCGCGECFSKAFIVLWPRFWRSCEKQINICEWEFLIISCTRAVILQWTCIFICIFRLIFWFEKILKNKINRNGMRAARGGNRSRSGMKVLWNIGKWKHKFSSLWKAASIGKRTN